MSSSLGPAEVGLQGSSTGQPQYYPRHACSGHCNHGGDLGVDDTQQVPSMNYPQVTDGLRQGKQRMATNFAVATAHGMANALQQYQKILEPNEEEKLAPRGDGQREQRAPLPRSIQDTGQARSKGAN